MFSRGGDHTSNCHTVHILDKVLATNGSLMVKADRGPPFNGHEFKSYMDTLGIDFPSPTPSWLQKIGTSLTLSEYHKGGHSYTPVQL